MTAAGAACPASRALRKMKGICWILGGHTDVAVHLGPLTFHIKGKKVLGCFFFFIELFLVENLNQYV